jgi:hypothetical protein
MSPVTKPQALAALDALDDYARMDTGVDAVGPRLCLETYLAQQTSAHVAHEFIADFFGNRGRHFDAAECRLLPLLECVQRLIAEIKKLESEAAAAPSKDERYRLEVAQGYYLAMRRAYETGTVVLTVRRKLS